MITRRSSIGTFFRPQPALLIRRHEDGNPHWLPCERLIVFATAATLGLASTFRRARRLGRGAVGFVQAPPHQALQLHDGLPHAAARTRSPRFTRSVMRAKAERLSARRSHWIAQLDSERPRLPGRGARVADGLDFVPGDRVPTREQLQPGNRAPTRKQLKTVPGYYEADRVCEALRVYDGSPQTINGHDDSAGDCATPSAMLRMRGRHDPGACPECRSGRGLCRTGLSASSGPVVANGYCGTEDGVIVFDSIGRAEATGSSPYRWTRGTGALRHDDGSTRSARPGPRAHARMTPRAFNRPSRR